MIVCPLLAKSCITFTTDSAMEESSPVVGSSQNNNAGLFSSSLANESRLASPPEKFT